MNDVVPPVELPEHDVQTSPRADAPDAYRVGILAFDGMEILDFAGPHEVFSVAGEMGRRGAEFEVVTIGVVAEPVCRGGLRITPTHSLHDTPHLDVVVIPGGPGSRATMADPAVLAWVRHHHDRAVLTLTVCTGSLIAAAAGLLADLHATTHHDAFGELETAGPDCINVVRGSRVVRSSSKLWTSAGVSAGIDLSLEVVAAISGPPLRDAVAAEMEWGWGGFAGLHEDQLAHPR